MRLLNVVTIVLVVPVLACSGKSQGGAAKATPTPQAAATVTYPDVAGTWQMDREGARNAEAARQTLVIRAGDKPGTYTASQRGSRGSLEYTSGRWQKDDLVLTGTDSRGGSLRLRLRFEGDRFTGSLSLQAGNSPQTFMVKGQRL